MSGQSNKMTKFDFMIGNWNLEYRTPKNSGELELAGHGTGTIKRTLNDTYVIFDYSASMAEGQKGGAHAIFAWDGKIGIYRFWWFEDSGSFLTATCNFINDETLFLSWHDTLLIQTFTKESPDKIILRMEQPASEEKFKLLLEVIFTRQ